MKVRSNALSQSGLFDYSTAAARATYTAAPKWDFTNASATTETFVRDISIAYGARKMYYIWAMPRTTAPSGGFKTETYVAHYKSFAEGTNTVPVAKTTTFAKGNTYYTGLDIDRPKMALEYVAARHVNAAGTGFVTTDANNDSNLGYFTFADANAKFANISIAGTSYHLPSADEIKAIVFNGTLHENNAVGLGYDGTPTTLTWSDNNEGTVSIGGKSANYTSDIQGTSIRRYYAIRFKNTGNAMATAYKYDFIGEGATAHLKITSRYVGPSNVTLATIAQDSYWNANTSDDKTVIIPFAGYRLDTPDAPIRRLNYLSAMWTSSVSTTGGLIDGQVLFTPNGEGWGSIGSTIRLDNALDKISVRLFSND